MKSIKFKIEINNLPEVIKSVPNPFYIDIKKINADECIVELTPSTIDIDEEKIFQDIMYTVLNIGSSLGTDEITFIY